MLYCQQHARNWWRHFPQALISSPSSRQMATPDPRMTRERKKLWCRQQQWSSQYRPEQSDGSQTALHNQTPTLQLAGDHSDILRPDKVLQLRWPLSERTAASWRPPQRRGCWRMWRCVVSASFYRRFEVTWCLLIQLLRGQIFTVNVGRCTVDRGVGTSW